MYYAMRASAPSLHRESTDSLIMCCVLLYCHILCVVCVVCVVCI